MLTFQQFLTEGITKEFKDIAFEYHDELHPTFWDGDKLRPEIRKQCLKIAQNFIASFKESKPKVVDITFTGSFAAYNYNPKSDVDIHVVIDADAAYGNSKINPEEFFRAQLKGWNSDHKDLTMKGFPVEVSVQMTNIPTSAEAIYSLLKDKWIKKATLKKDPEFDHEAVVERAKELTKELKDMMASGASVEKLEAFKDRIRDARKKALQKKGEFAVENLAFKAIRKAGLLDKLKQHIKAMNTKTLSLH